MKTTEKSPSYHFFSLMILLIGMISTILIYWPGIHSPLMFDDTETTNYEITLAQATDTQIPFYPLSHISIAVVNWLVNEPNLPAKTLNLAIHLMNSLLLYLLLVAWFGSHSPAKDTPQLSNWLLALISISWMVHPINLTNLLLISQRAVLLSTFFSLLAFIAYTYARNTAPIKSYVYYTGFALSTVLALFSGPVALLIPGSIWLMEWLLLNSRNIPLFKNKTAIAWLFVAIVTIGTAAFNLNHPLHLLYTHILTEPRALIYHLSLILFPRPGELGLFHDDIQWSTSLLTPISTLFFAILFIILFFIGTRFRAQKPFISFGFLFFLVGHLSIAFSSSGNIFSEQNNYLPSAGLLLAAISLFIGIKALALSHSIRIVVALIFCLFLGALTYGRALAWQNPNRLVMTLLHHHPESARVNYEAASIYMGLSYDPTVAADDRASYRQQSIEHYQTAAQLRPEDASPLLVALLAKGIDNKTHRKSLLDKMLAPLSNTNSRSSTPLEMDEKLLQKLPLRLAYNAISEATVGNLVQLSHCERVGHCAFEKGYISRLFSAVKTNPDLENPQPFMAPLLNELASRQLAANQLEEAEQLINDVIRLAPDNPEYRLNQVTLLITLGKNKPAQKILEQLQLKYQSKEIKKQSETLLKLIEQSQIPKNGDAR